MNKRLKQNLFRAAYTVIFGVAAIFAFLWDLVLFFKHRVWR